MHLSFWEIKNWFTNVDFAIVGSGIVGLHCALALRERYPKSKILVLEKGILPQGASTKNAGFACFGSLSEIIDDLKNHTEQEVINLINKRKNGLELLRKNLGDAAINYKQYGGYEIFLENDKQTYSNCLQKLSFVNAILKPLFKNDVFIKKVDTFKFQKTHKQLVYNSFEAQIDTGNMMQALLKKALEKNILILNNATVSQFVDDGSKVDLVVNDYSFLVKKIFFATNGFASKLTKNQVQPARAQVLITNPIKNLKIKGTFHLDKGYYYFRNFENRILLGGGRNLDFKTETTTSLLQSEIIQNKLEDLLKTVILPNYNHTIAHRWSGIMGVGNSKNPIVSQLSANVFCGVRMGGMGVAIGSLIGQELADLV